jgi:hypothetical protein
MRMDKIILISGKAEHGKDLSASILKEYLEQKGKRVVITRYALGLKEMAKTYCGWDGNKDDKGRELLQKLGTEKIRKEMNMPNFHVMRLMEDILICQEYFDYVIIPDCRFPNEVEMPKSMFGDKVVDIRVSRLNHVSKLNEEQLKHESEIALDNYKFSHYIEAENKEQLREKLGDLICGL